MIENIKRECESEADGEKLHFTGQVIKFFG